MVLLEYFKLCKKDACDIPLSILSKELESSITEAANDEVTAATENSSGNHSAHLMLDDEHRATIRTYAGISSFCEGF